MVEMIGLKAVLQDSDFQRGLRGYLSGMEQMRSTTASATGAMGGAFRTMGGAVQTAVGYMIGNVVLAGFRQLGSLTRAAASDAFDAVASYERLGLTLQSLVAREIAQGEKITVASQQRVSLTEKEREKIEDLRRAQEGLIADIPAAQARLEKLMAGRWTGPAKAKVLVFEDPRIINERQQALDALRQRLAKVTAEIAALESKEGSYVTVQKEAWINQIDMNEALAQAAPRAKELLDWIEMLAIKSPFGQEQVADAFRMALAYGFNTKAAQRYTKATMDWAAGSGATSEAMGRVMLALGQIEARGKLAGQEVLQLVNAGIPVRQILAKAFGVTTAELQELQEDGLLPAREVIEAIIESFEEDFPDAAAKQAESLAGLAESLQDLKRINLRDLFEGTFRAAQPFIARAVDMLSSPEFRGRLRGIGDEFGDILKSILGIASGSDTLPNLLYKLGFDPLQQMYLTGAVDKLGELWAAFREAWLVPAIERIGGALDTARGALRDISQGNYGAAFAKLGVPQDVQDSLANVVGSLEKLIIGDWQGALEQLGVPEDARQSMEDFAGSVEDLLAAFGRFGSEIFSETVKQDWSFLADVTGDILQNMVEMREILSPLSGDLMTTESAAATLARAVRDIVWGISQCIDYLQDWGRSFLAKMVETIKELIRLRPIEFFKDMLGTMGEFFQFFIGLPGLWERITTPPWAVPPQPYGPEPPPGYYEQQQQQQMPYGPPTAEDAEAWARATGWTAPTFGQYDALGPAELAAAQQQARALDILAATAGRPAVVTIYQTFGPGSPGVTQQAASDGVLDGLRQAGVPIP